MRKNIQDIRKENYVKIIINSVVCLLLDIILGTGLGILIDDFYMWDIRVKILVWNLVFVVSYTLAFLISRIYKSKFRFLNFTAINLAYLAMTVFALVIDWTDGEYLVCVAVTWEIVGAALNNYQGYKSTKKPY